jgi:hypothetical protein
MTKDELLEYLTEWWGHIAPAKKADGDYRAYQEIRRLIEGPEVDMAFVEKWCDFFELDGRESVIVKILEDAGVRIKEEK